MCHMRRCNMIKNIYSSVKTEHRAKDIQELRERIESRRAKQTNSKQYTIQKDGAVVTAG